jgi:hypothetical protein
MEPTQARRSPPQIERKGPATENNFRVGEDSIALLAWTFGDWALSKITLD